MARRNLIEIVIRGKDEASKVLGKITDGALRKIGESVTGLIQQLPQMAMEFVKMGAAAERQAVSLDNLAQTAGTTGDAIVNAIQGASDMTIDRMTAMEVATRAMLLEVAQTPDEFDRLTRVATQLGRAMGLTAEQSINDFVTAAGRQSQMIADNLGLMVKVTDATANYADKLGIAESELTDAQKKQAFLNEMLTQGEAKVSALGGTVRGSAGNIEALAASLSDLKLVIAEVVTETSKGTSSLLAMNVGSATLGIRVFRLQSELEKLGVVTKESVLRFREQDLQLKSTKRGMQDTEARAVALQAEYDRLVSAQADLAEANRISLASYAEFLGVFDQVEEATARVTIEQDKYNEQLERSAKALPDLSERMARFGQTMEVELITRTLTLTQGTASLTGEMVQLGLTTDQLVTSWASFGVAVGNTQFVMDGLGATLPEFAVNLEKSFIPLSQLRAEQGRLAEESARAEAELAAVSAELGDRFVSFVGDATDEASAFNVMLFEAADAADFDANALALLGGQLGIFTDAQIEAALVAVALQQEIEALGQAIADGSMTVDAAIRTIVNFVDEIDPAIINTFAESQSRATRTARGLSKAEREAERAIRDATRAAEAATREQARLAAETGDVFVEQIGDAAEGVEKWDLALFQAADTMGASAESLAVLGAALGVFTEEQAEAALMAATLQQKISELGMRITAGLGISEAIAEFNEFRDSLGLSFQRGGMTPVEIGGGPSAGGASRTNQTTNNFTFNVSTTQEVDGLRQDYQTAQNMAG